MRKQPLKEAEVIERLKKYKGFLYKQDQVKVPAYFDICYEYIMLNCIDKKKKELKRIAPIVRDGSYKTDKRVKTKRNSKSRSEYLFVHDMFHQDTDKNEVFGTLIGYQIPIGNNGVDSNAGRVDFISVIDEHLYLHEIKAVNSIESILKAILEVQTYYQQINHEKLISDFDLIGKVQGIKKAVVIFRESEAYKQMDNPKVKDLLEFFGIELFVLSNSNLFHRLG
jgi:hypothetical protein